jgi:release factor glutamine methyltransferase
LPQGRLTALVGRLRAVGCVIAEEEAAALLQATGDPNRLERLVQRRAAGEPLELIVGCVDFGGLRLAVGPRVFVRR